MFGGNPMNKKKRRHSGYVTPRLTISKKELIENDLFVNPFYDDWENYRDGFRDWFSDFKKIKKVKGYGFDERIERRLKINRKQKNLFKRRQARKAKVLNI